MTPPPRVDGALIVRAARTMLLEAGCPAYAVVAQPPECDGEDVRLGALAFTSHGSASNLARMMHGEEPAADVFVVERLRRVGKYRWTVWDLAGENRLHEEFEALPDWV